jgi:DNA-binding NarL/FixJ family response regulator
MIRVLVVDDHVLVRAGIRSLLEALHDVAVVAEAGDGLSALDAIARESPDVVVADVAMPGLNGIELIERLAVEQPGIRVLLVSAHASEEYVLRALRAGGAGYVLKDASPAELEQAIRAVAAGGKYLSPAMSRHVVDAYLERVTDDASAGPRLSPRQRQVLQMIAEGRSTKEIAAALSLSVKTVETHRAQLMERLDIHDVAGLVRYAIRVGLVRPDP